jgi:sterol desaturase/sphingolipid hydroxylase (fatty acid hydroxylase superfamily)
VEWVFGNVVPMVIGARLLQAHMVTFWLFFSLGMFEIADQHSGYEFPWNPLTLLPGNSGAKYHDFHHSKNLGNYASLFIHWDWIFGT